MWCANVNWVCQSALLAAKTKRTRHIYGSSTFNLKTRNQFPSEAIRSSFQSPYGADTGGQGRKIDSGFVWPSPNDKTPFWEKEFPSCDVSDSGDTAHIEKDSDPIHITHVTAEMAPIAKVGGLADVVTGLSRACLVRGHKVDIMLPFYECIQKNHIINLQVIATFSSYHDGEWIPVQAYHGTVSGIPVIFLDPSNHFFKGKHVYGGSYNELEAYLFFSRACLEYMQITGTQPNIIHVHEWQTSALPLLYWDMYQYLSLKRPRIVLTIHNMEHYGECTKEQLSKSGLDGATYATVEKVNSLFIVSFI